jgi:hypothetical protein
MEDAVPFGSGEYFLLLALLLFARGMDLLSTWLATPNLVLEGNPIARKLGWRFGSLINLILAFAFALWPLAAIVISTTSLLVAARNLQWAWLMRSLGEDGYRAWYLEQFEQANLSFYFLCLVGQTALVGAVGAALVCFGELLVPVAIGIGIVSYAIIVLFYTTLSLWRIRRRIG